MREICWNRRSQLLGALVVACAVVGAPVAQADTAFFLAGTDPIPLIPPPQPTHAQLAAVLGGRFSSDTLVNVNYPASVWPLTFDRPTMGRSIQIGAQMTEDLLDTTVGPKTVAGWSQGAMVEDQVERDLTTDPNRPSASEVTFVLNGDPTRPGGLFSYLPAGTTIPVLNVTVSTPPESPYHTIVLVQQYDGAADFPDRPWNLLADANAVMGFLYLHVLPNGYRAIPATGGTTTTNDRGGTTTTYLLPTSHLPLTEPLRALGIPAAAVDRIDASLRPMVDAGYSRNDAAGDNRPHLTPYAGRRTDSAAGATKPAAGRSPTIAPDQHTAVAKTAGPTRHTADATGGGTATFGTGRGGLR